MKKKDIWKSFKKKKKKIFFKIKKWDYLYFFRRQRQKIFHLHMVFQLKKEFEGTKKTVTLKLSFLSIKHPIDNPLACFAFVILIDFWIRIERTTKVARTPFCFVPSSHWENFTFFFKWFKKKKIQKKNPESFFF